jgi:hypothetical protein
MHFQPMPVGLEPTPNIGIFMIGGVVLDQDGSLATVAPSELFEKGQIGSRVKDSLAPVVEPRAPEFNGTKNLHAFALSGNGNFRRAPHAAPGGMQRGILAEAGSIGKQQRPVSRLGFF